MSHCELVRYCNVPQQRRQDRRRNAHANDDGKSTVKLATAHQTHLSVVAELCRWSPVVKREVCLEREKGHDEKSCATRKIALQVIS